MIHELLLSHHLIGYLNTRDKDEELLHDILPISELPRDELSQFATRNWMFDSLCKFVSLTEGAKALLATQVKERVHLDFPNGLLLGGYKKRVFTVRELSDHNIGYDFNRVRASSLDLTKLSCPHTCRDGGILQERLRYTYMHRPVSRCLGDDQLPNRILS